MSQIKSDPRDYAHEHSHGGMSRQAYEDDPKRLAFTLARYKHTAKLLDGFGHVLEVGCADGFGTRIVRQHVRELTAMDEDARSIEEAKLAASPSWPINFIKGSMTAENIRDCPVAFDAVYALDVLEHIRPDDDFLRAMCMAAPVAVIGTPSLESQKYASAMSKLGHVNCYSGAELRHRLRGHWSQVFLFTMHDEILGTSYSPMAQYLLALCVR
jgi:2-polyprenyl-3-methyl-5-hydroxy-6-metoxy-1,4-benzoquinol methylase